MSKTPYTSVTETVARILSLLITLLCFSIYILSKDNQLIWRVDWAILTTHLGIFWLAYEFFSFCFFLLLQQFAMARNIDTKSIESKPENKDLNQSRAAVEPTNDFDK
jgi:hypothetical protein